MQQYGPEGAAQARRENASRLRGGGVGTATAWIVARGVGPRRRRRRGPEGYLELLLGSRPSPSVTRHRRKARIVCREQARSLRWTSVARRRQRLFVLPARSRLPGAAWTCHPGARSGLLRRWEISSREKFLGSRHGLGAATTTRARAPLSSSRRLTDQIWLSHAVGEPNSGLTSPLPAQK